MEAEETVALLNATVDVDENGGSDEIEALSRRGVDLLDGPPLAIDLAGARIMAEIDNGEDAVVAMHQYFADFWRQQNRLLHSSDFTYSSPDRKTVWTAWETSLTALQKVSNNKTGITHISLLVLLL